MKDLRNHIARFAKEEKGQSTAEYALMLVLVAIAVAIATPTISQAIVGVFNRLTTYLA